MTNPTDDDHDDREELSDPFDDLDDPDDHNDDRFGRIDAGETERPDAKPDGDSGEQADGTENSDREEYPDWLAETDGDHPAVRAEADPFADLDDREGDPFEEDPFDPVETEAVDPDRAWEHLEDEADPTVEEPEGTVTEVSKRRYCERCEYFSPPPDVSCTHEGTEILGFPDRETVRMVDCPIVARRRELEESAATDEL
ncbi:hypothetical protein BRC62_00860 [Halobacteriales archaeon QH_10_67_13]|nr:MAG: hypothetical protein BRC62_00860 [Halobacteriales archaeon QH_10_67_13]